MKIETERLILREFLPTDDEAMFEMDSNPEVHKYLGNNPVTDIEQVQGYIASIRQQYIDYGIGRWAVVEKESGKVIGWAGLKFITEVENNRTRFHDVGYRLNQKYWGKGYATESAKAAIKFGFEKLQLTEIIGSANVANIQSRKALEKCGLTFVEKFYWKDIQCDWLKITKEDWLKMQK
ncbi:MAG: GNAT family N-acetyltransferase [Bacteroidota bacterium]